MHAYQMHGRQLETTKSRRPSRRRLVGSAVRMSLGWGEVAMASIAAAVGHRIVSCTVESEATITAILRYASFGPPTPRRGRCSRDRQRGSAAPTPQEGGVFS
jgi:hypothetical protein